MTIPKSLVALVALSLPGFLHAQPAKYWSTVDPRPDGYFIDGQKASFNGNGDGFVLGSVETYDEQSQDTIDVAGARLTKFTADGHVAWHIDFPNVSQGYGFVDAQVKAAPDGGVVVYFEWETGGRDDDLVLMKFSSAGAKQWEKDDRFPRNFVVGPDSSVYVTENDDPDGLVVNHYVRRIDISGNETTMLSFQMPNAVLYDLALDGSGGVWVAGNKLKTGGADLLLAHANAQGQTTSWTYSTFPAFGVKFLKVDANKDLIVAVSENEDSTQVEPTITFAKFHLDGSMAWQKDFSDQVDFVFEQPLFALDPSGNIIYGYRRDGVGLPILYKLDPQGNVLWSSTFNIGAAFQGLFDLLVDPGGNIFALYAAQHNPQTNNTFDCNLVKYLPDGTLGWPLPNGDLVFSEGQYNQPGGLGRDSSGRLYIGGNSNAGGRDGQFAVKYGPANNSTFVSQTMNPADWVSGQTYAVTMTFRNTGIKTWTKANNYYLRFSSPTDSSVFNASRVDLRPGDQIAPGQSKTFTFSVVTPMTPGTYSLQYRMAQNTNSFGEDSHLVARKVVLRLHAARYISHAEQTIVKAGSQFTVVVVMENVGTNTWTPTDGYSLSNGTNVNWGTQSVAFSGANVARGATKGFIFTCTAPAVAGSYPMKWQMHRTSNAFTGFFGDQTPLVTITVVP